MSIYFAPIIMLEAFSCFNIKVDPHNTPKSKAAASHFTENYGPDIANMLSQ